MFKRFVQVFLLFVLTPLGFIGCASASVDAYAGLEKSSPTQTAVGVRANVPFVESHAGELLAIGGVQRQWFDDGHDNVFTVGLQGRRTVSARGAWIGAEGTYNNWRVSDGFQDPVANVFGLGGLVGHPIGGETLHVFGSASVLFFGDFEDDDAVVFEGGTGWQFNIGLELRNLFGGN